MITYKRTANVGYYDVAIGGTVRGFVCKIDETGKWEAWLYRPGQRNLSLTQPGGFDTRREAADEIQIMGS